MDIFKGIGNFFRGAFKGDDEEKKRKQREEAQRKAQQQQAQLAQRQAQKQTTISSPSQLFGRKDGSFDIASPAQLQLNKQSEYDPRRDSPTNPAVIADEVGKATGKVFGSIANFGKGMIKDAGEQVADAIWSEKQQREADRDIKQKTRDKGLYSNPAYQKSRRDAIDEAEKSKAIDSNRANQLRQELEANINKSTEAVAQVKEEVKQKYGQEVKSDSELLFDAALAASNFAVGGGTTLKLVGKELVDSAAQKVLPQIVKEAEKIVGRQLGRIEFNTIVQKVRQMQDDLAKNAAIRESEKKIAEEAAETAIQSQNQSRRPFQQPPVEELAEPDTIERQLQDTVNDSELPTFERKRAQDTLDSQKRAPEIPQTGVDKPSFLVKREIDNVIRTEENNLNRYLSENPELTQAEVQRVRDAATERANKLIEDLRASRLAADDAVQEQITNLDETTKLRQKVSEEIADARTESVTPQSGDAPTPASTSPEVQANNAFTTDDLYKDAPSFTERGDLSFREKYNPERLFRENVSRPLFETLPNKAIAAAQTSDNAAARGLGRFFTGFSREAGLTQAELAARRHLRGSIDIGKLNRETIGDLSKNMPPESKEKVWATLDPEMANRKGIDVAELTPEELVLQTKLKGIIDDTTNEMLRRGLITPEAAANGSYIKRAYNVFDAGSDEAFKKFEGGFRTELLNQTKGRKIVSDEMVEQAITDPTYLVGKKTAEAEALFAMQDYGNFLVKNGTAVDGARPGFTQLPDSPVFGDAAGKWVPHNFSEDFTGFQYQNAFVSALNDVFTVYDRWNVRQAKKALLTVFNPAVRIGNQASNRMIFSTLGGINPASFNVKMAQVPNMIRQNHQLYREAVSEGLIGLDATQADFFAKQMANVTDDASLVKKFMAHMQKSYSGADDQAKIAAYSIYRERGYPVEEAAKMTQRQFQDYKSVGFFYDLASKTPIIGNAFVRFAGDAARIAKNTLIDRPLTAAGAVMTWGALTNLMSIASGESEFKEEQSAIQNVGDLFTGGSKSEDQKTREDRFGAPKVPFTDISLTVQTPFGEINAARFMPWHMLNDVSNGVTGMLPFSESPIKVEDGQVEVNPGAMDDPLLGQVVQLAIDEDFRSKSIADPKNSENRDKYAFDPATEGDKLGNRARFLAANNLPMGNELDSIVSALTGNEDRYGKTRSVPQAIARMFGIKIEEYGDKQVADQRSRQMYFDDMDKINEELKDMNPTEQEAWRRLTGYYKLREQVENNFEPGTTRDKKAPVYDFGEDKWKDYAANPRLYDLMVQKKQQDAARDGSPIQPEFDERLSASFRKQLIQNKMVAPGDDAELDQRMYSTPEWDYYMSLKDEYKAKSKEYYGDDEYTGDELVKHQDEKFPTKPDLLKEYSAAYGDYLNGKRDKPQFTDEMKLLKHDYNVATFNWTNNARLARGLPAITWDVWNNPTFGFDESKSGGFGFGGGDGRGRDTNLLGNLSNFSGTIKGLDEEAPVEEMPNTVALFQKLMANRSGGRAKPRLGASSRGQ